MKPCCLSTLGSRNYPFAGDSVIWVFFFSVSFLRVQESRLTTPMLEVPCKGTMRQADSLARNFKEATISWGLPSIRHKVCWHTRIDLSPGVAGSNPIPIHAACAKL